MDWLVVDLAQNISLLQGLALGACTLLLALCFSKPKLPLLLLRFLFAYFCLWFEDRIWYGVFGLPGPLPRNLDEMISDPGRVERLLRGSVLGEKERITSISKLAGISSEPAKQATAGSIELCIINSETGLERELPLFCKFQTGRGLPRYMQAIRYGAEPGVCREVDFYTHIRASLTDVKTAQPLLCLKSPLFNYVLIVLEHIELSSPSASNEAACYRVVNDYESATVSEVEAMLLRVAKIHKRFSGPRETARELDWIPARRGLDFCKWVEGFIDARECGAFSKPLFQALMRRFAQAPVTLVHGDFRPGNMIFFGPRDHEAVEDVLLSDWEATNVGPYLWDVCYCTTLGWSARARREHQAAVVEKYMQALDLFRDKVFVDEKVDLPLLVLVLAYVSRTIRVKKFWANQGNTSKDQVAWLVRVALAVEDLDAELVARELAVDVADITALQVQGRREIQDLFDQSLLPKPMAAGTAWEDF